jgi:ABC-type branched-subunit amino acid transport system substrate-binding protein
MEGHMTQRDTYNSQPEPIRIGLLSDMPAILNQMRVRIAQIVSDEYGGRIKGRPLEFRVHEFIGAPTSSTQNAVDGYHKLADEGCLVITGLNHSDNAMVVLEHAAKRKVPLIQMGASDALVNEYVFSVGWSYMANDTYLMANWCKKNGYRRVTIASDTAWHCQEYIRYFRDACRRWGIEVIAESIMTEFLGDEMRAQAKAFAQEHKALNPDALILLGSSPIAEVYARAAHEAGLDIPRCMNADFVRLCTHPQHGILPADAKADPALLESFTGWSGTSVYDEENTVFQSVVRRYEEKFGEPMYLMEAGASYYDAIHTAVEGVALAHLMSPVGVKDGLERLKQMPAAQGGNSNVINFGPWDRMAMKGKDGSVIRRITDGPNGKSVVDHRFDIGV